MVYGIAIPTLLGLLMGLFLRLLSSGEWREQRITIQYPIQSSIGIIGITGVIGTIGNIGIGIDVGIIISIIGIITSNSGIGIYYPVVKGGSHSELGVSIFRFPIQWGAVWSYLEFPTHLIYYYWNFWDQ